MIESGGCARARVNREKPSSRGLMGILKIQLRI
jgi:hypothetical protein